MTAITGKEQEAVDALEAAQQEGATLTACAKAKWLVLGELYNTLAGRRKVRRHLANASTCKNGRQDAVVKRAS
jgi:hypothetical protein